MLPVDMIRKALKGMGASEKRILKQIDYYNSLSEKDREDFMHSMRVTLMGQELFSNLDNLMDVEYDKDGNAIGVRIK